jgi:hypothetical protein
MTAGFRDWPAKRRGEWRRAGRVYQAVAIAYFLWMLYWFPVALLIHGPSNFLWLCNISQFLCLYALWTRHRLIASSQAGVVCIVGAVWTADFTLGLLTGGQTAVFTQYMWVEETPLMARVSSLYHIFLPVLVIYLIYTLGYDRRAPWVQTGIGSVALLLTILLTGEGSNINAVYSPLNFELVWAPHWVYVLLLFPAYPLIIYWPGHGLVLGILRWIRGPEREREGGHPATG